MSHGWCCRAIKRVVFGLVKSNKITINTAEEFATEASKAVPFIQSIYLSQDDEIMEPSFVKVAPHIQGTLDTHYVKRSVKSNGDCYLEFIDHRTILNLFRFNNILEQNLFCAIRQVQRATKMSVVYPFNFIMKMKRGSFALLARYGSMKNVLEKNFSDNFKDM